ncbi:hypothetical protein HMPREF2738_02636, partial [Clostridiales bacterium KLE1615]
DALPAELRPLDEEKYSAYQRKCQANFSKNSENFYGFCVENKSKS